ncbi:hypothetical protein DC347_20145 [Pseudarthrobacter sp. AG30]|uniref:hypothetical protein n=1 Tax=Pseudarthrobacter sp. AG30 TaxID=2249742 RepID=UPI000D6EACA3|nr:hypothetical protein [Pseudarthrobacter sp. AG30]RAX14915.1 hypothetical protein DC347_20145 [Pseudarthrobacter sp. AG30]
MEAAISTVRTQAKGWDRLEVGQEVLLAHPGLPPIAGTVDAMTDDREIIWVLSVPRRRQIIHIDDGYRVLHEGP